MAAASPPLGSPPGGALRLAALAVTKRIQDAGHAAFWVGGCVRDALLGRTPGDYDISTSARPEQVEALFPRTIAVGRQFGVVVVVYRRLQGRCGAARLHHQRPLLRPRAREPPRLGGR